VIGRLARRLRADEGGFTLTELLVAMVIGTIVLLVVFDLLDVSAKHYGKVDDRVDVIARGRQAMENITQEIRSQVCLGTGKPALKAGSDSSMQFVADLGDENFKPELRTLTYVPAAGGAQGFIREDSNLGIGAPPNTTFPAQTSTRHLVDNVTQTKAANGTPVPIFKYYSFTPNPATPTQLQTTPLDTDPLTTASPNNAARTVRIEVAFRVLPNHAQNSSVGSDFLNYVYVRTADVTDPSRSPQCL
jgi:prepilin-type N-terminal cleavage/methylation domain-containing protein